MVMRRSLPKRLSTSPGPRAWHRSLGDAGLSRESLYKALSGERGPDFETILKVVGALGLELHVKAAREDLNATARGAVRQAAAKPPIKAARAAAVAGRRRRRGAATLV
jgi:hypothetical protein